MSKSKGSWIRKITRQAKRDAGLTFTQRAMESVRTGQPIKDVLYQKHGKGIIAVEK